VASIAKRVATYFKPNIIIRKCFFLNCVSLSLFVFFHFACLCVRLAYLSTKVCVNTIGLPLYVTNWSMFKETSQELPYMTIYKLQHSVAIQQQQQQQQHGALIVLNLKTSLNKP